MKFFITTPIYYINGEPHIGHAYTSIAADIIARFKRLDGYDVTFLTGTDEHGLKVARSAEVSGKEIYQYCDEASQKFRDMSRDLNLSNDDFIRTTENRHKISARALWEKASKDIYKSTYRGWYSARDEEYISEEDLVDGKAPSGAAVEWMEEDSYFFRLSAYQDKLIELYESNLEFISPASKRNEIMNFVKGGLKDLSISRSKFNWGIDIPNAAGHVMYVWIDALANYITAVGYPDDEKKVNLMMSNCIHLVGKEILRFHAVYWPAFLMAAGIELPKKVFAHGWWTCEGQKMSKSIGNVIDPVTLSKKYTVDCVRYFLFREVRFGEDGDFSELALQNRINYDLANDLGNLVQRVLAFVQKLGGQLTASYDFSEESLKLYSSAKSLIGNMRTCIDKQDLHGALSHVWDVVSESNKFVNDMKPWELAKTDVNKLNEVLTVLCEAIRAIAFGINPYMPDTSAKIFGFLNVAGKSFNEMEENFVSQKFLAPYPLFPKEK